MSAKNEITPSGNSRVELALIYFGCCKHVLHPSAEEATKHLRVLREALALCESPAAETQVPIHQAHELLQALYPYIEWFGGAHDEECPQDDTCDCTPGRINERLNRAIQAVEKTVDGAHMRSAPPTSGAAHETKT